MEYISDILLGLGALAAAFYCVVLSRKLNRLSGLDQELGTAIAVLSKQVDDLTNVLKEAQSSAETARNELIVITERAERVAQELNDDAVMQYEAVDKAGFATDPIDTPEDAVPSEGGLTDGAPSMFLRHSRAAS